MRIISETVTMSHEISAILEKNGGRAADSGLSLPFLGSMVYLAGDGDHVDIGTLYGASAIMAALVKKKFNLKGTVYAIDPYDPATRQIQAAAQPGMAGKLSATPEEFLKNAEEFDVRDRIKLIQKKSYPWPEELKDNVFASAYIDGDHNGDATWNDFLSLRGRVTHYIGCDNYEEEYSDVVSAMVKAMDSEDWFLFYKNITFLALRRLVPPRGAGGQMSVLQL